MKTHAHFEALPVPRPPFPSSGMSRGAWRLVCIGLASLSLSGCFRDATPVVRVENAIFLEGDSVVVSLEHRYLAIEESDIISVSERTERGIGRFRRHRPAGPPELLLELTSLHDRSPGLVQVRGDALVYSIHSRGLETTRLRDLSTSLETEIPFRSPKPFRLSTQGRYFFHEKRVLDRSTLAGVDSLTPPPNAELLLLRENGPEALIAHDGALKLWNPATGVLRTLRSGAGRILRRAQGDSVLLVQEEWPPRPGKDLVYSYANIGDLWRGDPVFRYLTVPSGYRAVDLFVPTGSVLAVKAFEEGASDDTLYVFDLSGSLKRKFAVGP
jgi:hypothetical protein